MRVRAEPNVESMPDPHPLRFARGLAIELRLADRGVVDDGLIKNREEVFAIGSDRDQASQPQCE